MKGFCASLVLIYCFVFGILDWASDIWYYIASDFKTTSMEQACLIFILLQPFWYLFVYIAYVATHNEIESTTDRIRKVALAPIYALGQQFKLFGTFECTHALFAHRFGVNDSYKLFLIDNCFIVQTLTEFALENLP